MALTGANNEFRTITNRTIGNQKDSKEKWSKETIKEPTRAHNKLV
jgi:hypothetical protein